jgi:hypothetical protein
MPHLAPPPMPNKMQEMFKDYPEHIQTLQDDLNRYIEKPFRLMPFDGAIWALESTLDSFISKAREELKTAEVSGESALIEDAEKKELFMLHAGSISQYDLSELQNYLETHKEQIL